MEPGSKRSHESADRLVPEYEPPRIESVLPGDELEREAFFAGGVTIM